VKIVTTNLAMRFYKNDGWGEADLLPAVVKHTHPEGPFKYFSEDALPYWIPNVGTRLDLGVLLEKASQVQRMYDENPCLSDREFLEKYNW
jgi:hypothetical protein